MTDTTTAHIERTIEALSDDGKELLAVVYRLLKEEREKVRHYRGLLGYEGYNLDTIDESVARLVAKSVEGGE